jgi:hypothetical protein
MNALAIALMACLTLSLTGCAAQDEDLALTEFSQSEEWRLLASRRVFFAHKSVGQNIVDGISELQREYPSLAWPVIQTRSPADLDAPAFVHAENGVNGDPLGKLAAFRRTIDNGFGARLDLAILKFCWADFTAATDVATLFAEYRDTLAAVENAHPNVTFVHFTVPLTIAQSGVKAWAKTLLGKPVFGIQENIARNQYNDMIRREYRGRKPLFDLAALESTRPDGSRERFEVQGRLYEELIPDYASDSGHLNKMGQRMVAAHLVKFLASIPQSRRLAE